MKPLRNSLIIYLGWQYKGYYGNNNPGYNTYRTIHVMVQMPIGELTVPVFTPIERSLESYETTQKHNHIRH